MLACHYSQTVQTQNTTYLLTTHVLVSPFIIFLQDLCILFPKDFKGLMELKNMVDVVPRNGRLLQRYNTKGRRLVVGCIPYRYKVSGQTSLHDEQKIEVLLISSQRKGKGMMFPKGGWESDESIKDAALRETVEEAGVSGTVEDMLDKWTFKSNSQDVYHEGYMFPLLVTKQLEVWPEKDIRQRIWMSVAEAKEACQHGWMNEALDKLVHRLKSPQQHEEEKNI